MKTIVIKILLVFALCNTAFSQGLPIEMGVTNGMLSFQYADSSYNYYNPCNVTRIQTFERYPNVVWVYILEDETVRIEKIDVTALYSPVDFTTSQVVDWVSSSLGSCLTDVLFVTEKFYEGWLTTQGVWRTNNKSWFVN